MTLSIDSRRQIDVILLGILECTVMAISQKRGNLTGNTFDRCLAQSDRTLRHHSTSVLEDINPDTSLP